MRLGTWTRGHAGTEAVRPSYSLLEKEQNKRGGSQMKRSSTFTPLSSAGVCAWTPLSSSSFSNSGSGTAASGGGGEKPRQHSHVCTHTCNLVSLFPQADTVNLSHRRTCIGNTAEAPTTHINMSTEHICVCTRVERRTNSSVYPPSPELSLPPCCSVSAASPHLPHPYQSREK